MEKYSFSKLRCFESCPLSFYKRYYERPENPLNHGTSEFGSFMHNILEDYANGKIEIPDMLPYYLENFNQNIVSDFTLQLGENFTKDFYFDYFESGKRYLENFQGFTKLHKILEAEYEFEEVVNDAFIFNGKVDLVAEDENGDLIIVDHKSKSSFKNKAELAEYAVQLYLYAFAIERKYGKLPVKLVFNMFRKDIWQVIEFKQEDYEAAMKWLVDSVNEVEGCFDFTSVPNTFFCNNFCSYRDNCEEKAGD